MSIVVAENVKLEITREINKDLSASWKSYQTGENFTYFHNFLTKISVWDDPQFIYHALTLDSKYSEFTPFYWECVDEGLPWLIVHCREKRTFFTHRDTLEIKIEIPEEIKTKTDVNVPEPMDEPPMLQKFERRQLKIRELQAANMLDEEATQKLAPINKYKEELEEMEEEDEISKEFHNYIGRNIQSELAKASIEILNKTPIFAANSQKSAEFEDKPHAKAVELPVEKIEKVEDFPKEVEEFKQMLRDVKVMPFSLWEKELPKLIHDKRFKDLPAKFRKMVFEEFVKNYHNDLRKNKAEQKKVLSQTLGTIFEEYEKQKGSHTSTSYSAFRDHFKNDQRYVACLSGGLDVESLFRKKVDEWKIEWEKEHERLKEEFTTFLKEELESETVDKNLKWKHIKKKLKKKEKYNLISSSSEREKIFERIKSDILALKHEADRKHRKEKDEQDRLQEEQERRMIKVKKVEAISEFKVFLAERVKNKQITYEEAKEMFKNDTRFENEYLPDETRKTLLENFLYAKNEEQRSQFKRFLYESLEPNLQLTFQDAMEKFKTSVKYSVWAASNFEDVFDEYKRNMRKKIFEDFEKFVEQSPFIHKDVDITNPKNFEDYMKKLASDVRFTRMDPIKDIQKALITKRIEVLRANYEEKLYKKGKLRNECPEMFE